MPSSETSSSQTPLLPDSAAPAHPPLAPATPIQGHPARIVPASPAVGPMAASRFVYPLCLLGVLVAGVVFYTVHYDWTVPQTLYFFTVVLTTIGYGDEVPLDDLGRFVTMMYVLFLVFVLSQVLGQIIEGVFEKQQNAVIKMMEEPPENHVARGGMTKKEKSDIVVAVGSCVVLAAVGAAWMMLHEGTSLVLAMYFVVVTMATVGFGDVVVKSPISRGFVTLWAPFATVALANMVGTIAQVNASKQSRMALTEVLNKGLTNKNSFSKIDQDGDNKVSKLEYLMYALVRTEQVEQAALDAILKRFDEMDMDGSGFVDDLEAKKSERKLQ